MTAGGHPSDADRERDALPVLEAVLEASRARDVAALAELYDDDVVWLAPDVTVRGRAAALERHAQIAARAVEWSSPSSTAPARRCAGWTATGRVSRAGGRGAPRPHHLRRGRLAR